VIATRRAVAQLAAARPAGSGRVERRTALARIGRAVPLPRGARQRITAVAGPRSDEIVGAKVCLSVAGAFVGAVSTRLPVTIVAVLLFAFAGWRAPHIAIDRRGREREAAVRGTLPDALDLLAACALAGMAIDQALRVVAAETDGVLGEALTEMTRSLDAGVPRRAAYEQLAVAAPAPEVRSLVRALVRAERYGTPVAPVLVAQAREVRGRRRVAAEEAARSAPVRMLFPLVLCFLPAFVLLTVAPIVLTALRSFRTP
jgi:tight adherence protein C